jgi:sialate O-acetylesterase
MSQSMMQKELDNSAEAPGSAIAGLQLVKRLAYGSSDPDYSGPVYQSYEIAGNKIILHFSHTGSGLIVNGGGDLYYFSIADANKKFVWASAKIEGDKITVWNEEVPNPVVVRYAWADNPEGANLYNKKGLPASPFETGQNNDPR